MWTVKNRLYHINLVHYTRPKDEMPYKLIKYALSFAFIMKHTCSHWCLFSLLKIQCNEIYIQFKKFIPANEMFYACSISIKNDKNQLNYIKIYN